MKTHILTIFILICSMNAIAQPKREEIKALKVSFLTERLSLTEKEAQEFWPIYNAYEKTTIQIKHKELKDIRSEIKENLNSLNDTEAKTLLNQLMVAQDKLHKENEQLIIKLKGILSPKKILMLRVAEEDFKRKLFEQYKRHRQEHRNKD